MAKSLMKFIPLLLLLGFPAVSFSSKILSLMPMGSKSHYNFFDSINIALVNAGHQVTMISPFNRTEPIRNIIDVHVKSDFESIFVGDAFEVNIMQMGINYIVESPHACVSTILEEDVQNALKQDYDFIILSFLSAECYFPTILEKGVPWAFMFPSFPLGLQSEVLGNVEFLSIVPDRFGEAVLPLTFFDRYWSTALSLRAALFVNIFYYRRVEYVSGSGNLWRPRNLSAISFAATNSFAIINSVRELVKPARPYPPTYVFAGGIHIKPPKPLSKDLDSWVQGSGDDGIILFSLGSIVKSSLMKETQRKIFVNVFSKLHQRVLWKWDGEHMDDLPPNVKLMDWVPQTDILAHPKLRLFISHGGLLSTQEATYFGVRILGMPVFVDQFQNVARAFSEGWALRLHWKELTDGSLFKLITDGINNKSLLTVVKQRSIIMKDQPLAKDKEVVFWVEYALRHGGMKHLRSPLATMSWCEIYNMDVWVFHVLVIFLQIYMFVKLSKWCRRCCKKIGEEPTPPTPPKKLPVKSKSRAHRKRD